MEHADLLRDILIRITLLLACGWLILFALAARNPRWSVLLTRCLAVGCLLFPLACLSLPEIRLEVLAPVEEPATLPVSEQAFHVSSDIESLPVAERQTEVNAPAPVTITVEPQPSPQGLTETETIAAATSLPAPNLSGSKLNEQAVAEIPAVSPQAVLKEEPTIETSLSLTTWFWLVWSAGVGVLLCRLLWQIRQSFGLRSRSTSAPESVQQQCQSLVEQLPLIQRPSVRFSTDIEGPCTAGLFHPVIYLPGDWYASLSETEQRVILLHELAHVAGRDVHWNLLARLSAIIWWFHPLVWRIPARHRLACEHLSDAQAARAIDSVSDYRRLLAKWALRRQGVESRLAALTMADRSQMLRRLKWLERPRQINDLARVPRGLFVACIVFLISGIGTIVLIPRTAQSEVEANSAENKRNSSDARPQEQLAKASKNQTDLDISQMVPYSMLIVDEQRQPVPDASIRIDWWEDQFGRKKSVAPTDPPLISDKGQLRFKAPTGAVRAHISVEAKGFLPLRKTYLLDEALIITLKPGRIIRVKAVNAAGKPLSDAYALLEDSNLFGREIKRDADRPGYYQSSVVNPDRRWMRVVDGSQPGPILFSPLIDVSHPEEVEADGTIVARLQQGIRLEGRLDDSVPRPIRQGCVELYINEAAEHKIGGGWSWQDTALVREDGTFVFESLPAGGYVQLFALVDGYQSAQPTDEELETLFPNRIMSDAKLVDQVLEQHSTFRPHVFQLPLDQPELKLNLPCSRTAAFDLTVLNPTGHPLTNARAQCAPQGLFIGGKSFTPGNELLSQAQLVRQKNAKEVQRLQDWLNISFMNVPTDQTGIAHVRNLPSRGQQRYFVSAPGYFMPPYPSLSTRFPSHYAVIDLKPGETLQRTVTMSRDQRLTSRELMIMDQTGNPLPNAQVTVSEITFRNAPDNWQVWSTPRFGPVVSKTSNKEGKVSLRMPTLINNQGVSRLRITIQLQRLQSGQAVNFQTNLVIPRLADDRVAVLTIPDQLLADQPLRQKIKAAYLHPDDVVSSSPEILLNQFQKNPSLFIFNRLLRLSHFNAVTPLQVRYQMPWVEFDAQYKRSQAELYFPPAGMDWDEYRIQKANEVFLRGAGSSNSDQQRPVIPKDFPRPAIYRLSTDAGERVVVLCDVRPSRRVVASNGSFLRDLPTAAFVFDAASGSLICMIGGGVSSSGDQEEVKLINLGGTRDYFIVTAARENHPPFNSIQHWYQLGQEAEPALTIQGHTNATRWTGTRIPALPEAESGCLTFHFEGQQLDFYQCGQLPNGVVAPRNLFWDSVRNQFIGPSEQSVDGKPLYRVDLDNSPQFLPLKVVPGELIVAGGRHDAQHYYQWQCCVPEGKTARLRLFSIDESQAEPVETEYLTQDLQSGPHNLRFQFQPTHWEDRTDMVVSIDELKKKEFTVPRVRITNAPSVAGTPIARTGKTSLDLFNRKTVQKQKRLIWRVTLKP